LKRKELYSYFWLMQTPPKLLQMVYFILYFFLDFLFFL